MTFLVEIDSGTSGGQVDEVESVDILGGKGMFTTQAAFDENWLLAMDTTARQYTYEIMSES